MNTPIYELILFLHIEFQIVIYCIEFRINHASGMKNKICFAALAAKADGLQRGKLTHGL